MSYLDSVQPTDMHASNHETTVSDRTMYCAKQMLDPGSSVGGIASDVKYLYLISAVLK